MRFAFVTPRYGAEVIGGAELGARLLAEQLVARLGWSVEVFTTCALESSTWVDHYPPGTVELAGVRVHRFASTSGRAPGFDALSDVVLRSAHPSTADQRRWIAQQGPVCPDAVAAAEASAAELVAFYPYLYYPTVVGVPRLADRALLHAAAHDERPIRLPLFEEVFRSAAGLVFHTDGEQRLVERLFPTTIAAPQIVLGLGSETGEGDADLARSTVGGALADGRPYLVCVGRVDRGKGTDLLVRSFAAYKDRHPERRDLALVFVGPVVHPPDPHPDVVVAGVVDEATKWGLLRGAEVLVSPSGWESFSFVVLEAWSAGIPVLVNAVCDATRDHCATSGGGLWFDGYASFEAALDRLLDDRRLAGAMARAGAAYVDRNYRWPVVIDRYRTFCALVAGRRSQGA